MAKQCFDRDGTPSAEARLASQRLSEVAALLATVSGATRDATLALDTPLGRTGLGLDSVGVVELLLLCEERFDVRFPDTLLAIDPLTVGHVVAHFTSPRR